MSKKMYARIIQRDFVKRRVCEFYKVDVTDFHGEETADQIDKWLVHTPRSGWYDMPSWFPKWEELRTPEQNAWTADKHFEITTRDMRDDWMGPAHEPLEVTYRPPPPPGFDLERYVATLENVALDMDFKPSAAKIFVRRSVEMIPDLKRLMDEEPVRKVRS